MKEDKFLNYEVNICNYKMKNYMAEIPIKNRAESIIGDSIVFKKIKLAVPIGKAMFLNSVTKKWEEGYFYMCLNKPLFKKTYFVEIVPVNDINYTTIKNVKLVYHETEIFTYKHTGLRILVSSEAEKIMMTACLHCDFLSDDVKNKMVSNTPEYDEIYKSFFELSKKFMDILKENIKESITCSVNFFVADFEKLENNLKPCNDDMIVKKSNKGAKKAKDDIEILQHKYDKNGEIDRNMTMLTKKSSFNRKIHLVKEIRKDKNILKNIMNNRYCDLEKGTLLRERMLAAENIAIDMCIRDKKLEIEYEYGSIESMRDILRQSIVSMNFKELCELENDYKKKKIFLNQNVNKRKP